MSAASWSMMSSRKLPDSFSIRSLSTTRFAGVSSVVAMAWYSFSKSTSVNVLGAGFSQKPSHPNLWLTAVPVMPSDETKPFKTKRPAPAMLRLQGGIGGKDAVPTRSCTAFVAEFEEFFIIALSVSSSGVATAPHPATALRAGPQLSGVSSSTAHTSVLVPPNVQLPACTRVIAYACWMIFAELAG